MIDRRLLALAIFMFAPAQANSQDPSSLPDWTHAEVVTVQLSNFRFAPSTIMLKLGQPYDLRLENQSSGGHNFAAKEFFLAAQVMDTDREKVADGKIALEGGQSVDIHLIMPRAGTYKLRCTHFMHSSFGMTGEILVQ